MNSNPLTVRWWPHTNNPNVASYRLRCLNIIESLKHSNLDVSIYKFGEKPNIIVLSKRYDLNSINHALALKESYQTKIFLDLCDNHFYSQNKSEFWDKQSQQLRNAVEIADIVIACSNELKKVITQECSMLDEGKVRVIEDAIEEPFIPDFIKKWSKLSTFKLLRLKYALPTAAKHLVWFGSHGSTNADSGMNDLKIIKSELNALNIECPISLTVISNNKKKFKKLKSEFNFPMFYLDWNRNTFSEALLLHDLVVLPINKNPFTICKTNNRLATAVMHNLAVACTLIPSYEPFTNFIIADNWGPKLKEFLNNKPKQLLHTQEAQNIINQDYSTYSISTQWFNLLSSEGVHD